MLMICLRHRLTIPKMCRNTWISFLLFAILIVRNLWIWYGNIMTNLVPSTVKMIPLKMMHILVSVDE